MKWFVIPPIISTSHPRKMMLVNPALIPLSFHQTNTMWVKLQIWMFKSYFCWLIFHESQDMAMGQTPSTLPFAPKWLLFMDAHHKIFIYNTLQAGTYPIVIHYIHILYI